MTRDLIMSSFWFLRQQQITGGSASRIRNSGQYCEKYGCTGARVIPSIDTRRILFRSFTRWYGNTQVVLLNKITIANRLLRGKRRFLITASRFLARLSYFARNRGITCGDTRGATISQGGNAKVALGTWP